MTTSRASILDGLYLSDGVTLAKDAAIANGVSEATLRFRLKKGLALDEAVKPVEKKPNAFQRGEYAQAYVSPAEWDYRQLCALASLPNGEPAWPLAAENQISEKTFRARLARGWEPARAATEAPRVVSENPVDDWEKMALENGISLRAYRARVKAGWPSAAAAMRPNR